MFFAATWTLCSCGWASSYNSINTYTVCPQSTYKLSVAFECDLFNEGKLMQSLDHSCDRKLEIDPCIWGSKLWVHMRWKAKSLLSLSQSHSVTQIHIQQGPCPDSHTLWQPVQFTRAVDRTAGCELDTRCVCVCVCLHAATAEPALAQTLGSLRICSWWSQTFPPWRRAGGTARYQTSYCKQKAQQNILLHNHRC